MYKLKKQLNKYLILLLEVNTCQHFKNKSD